MRQSQTSPLFLITGIKAAKFVHLETPTAEAQFMLIF